MLVLKCDKMNAVFPYLFIFFSAKCVLCGNILYLATMATSSQHIFNKALALGLVEKGHNVTYLCTEDDNSEKPKDFYHISLEGVHQKLHDKFNVNKMADYTIFSLLQSIEDWTLAQCEYNLETEGFKQLLNYPADFRFDLIVIDVTMGTCFYPMMKRFGYPPSVAVTPFLLPQYVATTFGNPLLPSIIPWYGLAYTSNMSFWERFWNTFYTYLDIYFKYSRQYFREEALVRRYFGEDLPSMVELERHFSLLLANTSPLVDHPQPLPPNIIPVGGLHTREARPIAQDLQDLLDNSANGVIVFSLGTNIRSDKLSKLTQNALLKAFSHLKETVLWKFESEIENLPKNVIVRKWIPQGDILGHHNVRLFIGHGGALSTQEAVFHGVPMIVVPFMIDQHTMAKIICDKNIGISLDHSKITSEYVLKALEEILRNPLYAKNMKQLSQAFKDSPQTPLERAVFWTEYVLRNNGADFLSLSSRDMPLYQATGLDVFLFVFTVILAFLAILYKSVRMFVSLFLKSKKLKTH